MVKAKVKFLWYSVGDEIKEEDMSHVESWQKKGLVEGLSSKKKVKSEELDISKLDKKSKERIKDIAEDLADDGKRNRSNKKKSVKKK